MTRTQLYLDAESRRLATMMAKLEGTTISEVIRRSVRAYAKPKRTKNKRDIVAWIEALNKKYPTPANTPTDLGLEHDHYLYGTPKKHTKQ